MSRWHSDYTFPESLELQGQSHVKSQGRTQYKRSYGDVPQTWVAKSASWYIVPYFIQNLTFEFVDFQKFSQIWAKNGSNLRKFEKMSGNLV